MIQVTNFLYIFAIGSVQKTNEPKHAARNLTFDFVEANMKTYRSNGKTVTFVARPKPRIKPATIESCGRSGRLSVASGRSARPRPRMMGMTRISVPSTPKDPATGGEITKPHW